MLLKHILNAIRSWSTNFLRRFFRKLFISRARRLYPKMKGGRVRRLTSKTMEKYGHPVNIQIERDALKYIAKHTSIPVPAVYDFWVDKDSPEHESGHLIMEYKDGELLQRRWRTLSSEQKLTIIRQLHNYVLQLRDLKQPLDCAGWVASPSFGPFCDFMVSGRSHYGPFKDEADFNSFRISFLSSFGDIHPPTAARIAEIRDCMPSNHRIVFTHGDIARQNILVKTSGDGPNDVSIVALLDWEQSGWRPEHWEIAKLEYGQRGDWCSLAMQEIQPSFRQELDREQEMLLISGPRH